MKKRIISVILSVLTLLSAFSMTVYATDGAQVVAENYTASQGGYAYVYLRADKFVDVAVLDIEVYYDSSLMSVHYVSNGTLFSGASVSTNTSTPGVIKISAMSVKGFNSGSSNSSNRMMTICFKINAACPVGEYPITITIGDAYDSSLNPVPISGVKGTVTVTQATIKEFSISTSKTVSDVQFGDNLTLTVSHSSSNTFASADFHIEYDRELLRIVSIELDPKLLAEGMIHTINSNNPGLAIISFASSKSVSSSNLFKVNFEVIANTTVTANIKITASDVYTDQLTDYAAYTHNTSVNITERQATADYPNFEITADKFVVGKSSVASVVLQGGAKVAAGDFVIAYNPDIFSVTDVKENGDILAKGALVYINGNYTEGQIKFSYINQQGSFEDDAVILNISLTPIVSPDEHYVISASGKDVCDLNFDGVQLDYVPASGCVYAPKVTAPTCTDAGFVAYSCSCGEGYIADTVEATGHSYGDWIIDKEATTTEEGSKHKECSACGDTVTESIEKVPITSQIVRKGKTLEYKDLIYVKHVFDLVDIDLTAIDLSTDAGLLCWTQEEYAQLSEIAYDPSHALVGLAPYPGSSHYFGKSEGIFTRYLADEYYYVGYVKLPDGSYIYSEPLLYGPQTYAYNMLGKATTSQKTRQLCVALLNYIAAAQKYFYPGIAESALANAGLTDEQKALDWSNAPENFNLAGAIPEEKTVQADTTVFTRSGKNLRFQEMISLLSVYQINSSVVANAEECGTIFWTAEQFAALNGAPGIDNIGSGKKIAMESYGSANMWCSVAPAVAAKDMADTSYYILGYVKHRDGTVSYSGVMSYSFEQYIYNKVTDSETSAEMLEFAKRLYVYEREACNALK